MSKGRVALKEEKERAREQWGQDPCGEIYGREHEFGTREFFDEVERHRYTEYAPWMPSVMGFNQFKGARLLEIGCGMGTDLLQFARGGARVTGADLTPRSVEISKKRFELYGQQGEFVITDGERLPFADESFDVVYSNGVLHHTPGTDVAVSEAHRVLRRGGVAKVMLYHRNSLAYWGELFFRRGILGGELLRGRSMQDVMSKWVEISTADARPLVKVYSRSEAAELFKEFSEVRTEVEQMTRAELRFLKHMPESLFQRVRKAAGWNVIITAKK
jgi:ubiquinone/menaquinone biosynthesis C-methylase UbiE